MTFSEISKNISKNKQELKTIKTQLSQGKKTENIENHLNTVLRNISSIGQELSTIEKTIQQTVNIISTIKNLHKNKISSFLIQTINGDILETIDNLYASVSKQMKRNFFGIKNEYTELMQIVEDINKTGKSGLWTDWIDWSQIIANQLKFWWA